MRQESQARKRVAAAFPKVLEDFMLPGTDDTEAMHEYDRYCEHAEEMVGKLLDRTKVPATTAGQAKTVAEVAMAELKSVESRGGRDVAQAAARQRRLASDQAQDVAVAEAEAEAMAREIERQELRQQARARKKRVRTAMTMVLQDGTSAGKPDTFNDDDEDDEDEDNGSDRAGSRRANSGVSRLVSLAASSLAGVTAASASGARMRRPAMPHIAPPRPLDRSTAPPAQQDAREASDAALEAVGYVHELAAARQWTLATGSIGVKPSGTAAALQRDGKRVTSALGAAARKRLRDWVTCQKAIA
jgi:hypothetical protein